MQASGHWAAAELERAQDSELRKEKWPTEIEMLKQVRDTLEGKSKDGKPSTKSGHISDVEFEPLPPLLVTFSIKFSNLCFSAE